MRKNRGHARACGVTLGARHVTHGDARDVGDRVQRPRGEDARLHAERTRTDTLGVGHDRSRRKEMTQLGVRIVRRFFREKVSGAQCAAAHVPRYRTPIIEGLEQAVDDALVTP